MGAVTGIGIGVAILDAQCNVYVAGLSNAPFKLGIAHALYGVGGVVSPLAGTSFLSHGYSYRFFYLLALAICLVNMVILVLAFRLQHEVEMEATEENSTELENMSAPVVPITADAERQRVFSCC